MYKTETGLLERGYTETGTSKDYEAIPRHVGADIEEIIQKSKVRPEDYTQHEGE
jgi:hypothetical protein